MLPGWDSECLVDLSGLTYASPIHVIAGCLVDLSGLTYASPIHVIAGNVFCVRRIYPLTHFQKKYGIEEIYYTGEVCSLYRVAFFFYVGHVLCLCVCVRACDLFVVYTTVV